ncbi:MAG: Tol-Pal system protein TolB [Magnetococcales bacterium]|nr:Tol-Pal system protein TolB [Magnetococcales bacterium]
MIRILTLLFVFMLGMAPPPGHAAELRIDITKGGLNPMPIAVPDFVTLSGDSPSAPTEHGIRIAEVVNADLERSGLFRPLDPKAFLQDSVGLWKAPDFRNWRLLSADAVVAGGTTLAGDKLSVDFVLYDVNQGGKLGESKRISAPTKDWRHLAHRVADEIYSRLTGEGGYFTSRIGFVAQKNIDARRFRKWLSVMDQDGANRVDLNPNELLVLTPRFSPNGEHLYYLSYETGFPRIFRWGLYERQKAMLTEFPGLNACPSLSPDGTRMAMTLTKDGNAEIYVKDLRGGGLKRLTESSAIDTSPSWSPDGNSIVFTSSRGGSPQIYVMDANGGGVKRLSFEGKNNSAPAWSPRGDNIAYVQGGGGKFRIAVLNPKTGKSRTLTDSWMDESPTWSPNGRVILFSRQNNSQTKLYTIDLTGHNERMAPVGDLGGSDPTWSPLIR